MKILEKIKNINLEKMYLLTYVCTFSIIIFLRSSQFGTFITNASDKHSIFYILYVLATLIGILMNLFITSISDYTNKRIILWTVFLLILSVVPMFFGASIISLPYLLMFLFINNAKASHPIKIIKYDFWMRTVLFIFTVFLYVFHLYPLQSKVDVVSRLNDSGVQRYSFGFAHPNVLALFILTLLISFIIAYRNKVRKISGILTITLVYIVTFILTDSRFFELSGLVLIVGVICYSSKVIKKWINLCTVPLMILCLFVGCMYFYIPYLGYKVFNALNILFSNRINIGIQALHYYPIRLIGYGSTPLLDINHANIDDMYMGYMQKFGIIGFIILQFYFYISAYMSRKNNNYLGNILLIVISVAIITINTNLLFAPMLYIVSTFFMDRKENNNEFMG